MAQISTAPRAKRRVVIVDNSRTMQAALEQILSLRLGFDIVGMASDVETAVSMVEGLKPDLVTIGLRMTYIDGKALLERLVHFTTMQKLVISDHAHDNLAIVSTLKQLGADAFIDKHEISRDPDAFCKKVHALVAFSRKRAGPRLAPAAADQIGTRPGSDLILDATNPYPVPIDEQARLRRLAALDLANDDEDAQLDRLTAHLGRTTDFPTCLMTFIDRTTQWIKSAHGFSRGMTERAEAFCNYTLCGGDALIVPDTLRDDRFKGSRHVLETPRIRSYVGHPITSATGVRLGAICLLDIRPRRVSTADVVNLTSICGIAGSILDARTPLREKAA